jgi:hypothetical protein
MNPDAVAAEITAARRDFSEASAAIQRCAVEFLPAVNHVAVKLPEFWTKEPELWFLQAETNFRHAKITCSLTKYD